MTRNYRAFTLAISLLVLAAMPAVQAETYSWQKPHAKILPTGHIEWQPEPFVFQPGAVMRYIDFEGGNDNNDGTKASPWKHHPWDAKASGKAKAAHGPATYVFKGGVVYRGKMRATESGEPGNPIHFTSDPTWGDGPARIYGSVRITSGWKRCTPADAPGIPSPEKVWYNDLGEGFDRDSKDTRLSAIWRVDGREVKRIHIARAPNWTITNPDKPTSNWYLWETFVGAANRGWLADTKHWLGKPKDFFKGCTIWTEHRNLMGSVHRIPLQEYDPSKAAFKISSPGGALYRRGGRPDQPYQLGDRVHYYIENVRGLLDSPGEYFYDVDGPNPGRLYIRLDDDSSPNEATLEIAQIRSPIEIFDRNHIEVSNLSFSYNDDDDGLYGYPFYISASPMVRAVGNCNDIKVHHCTFHNVMNAVVAFPRPSGVGGPAQASERDIGKFANDVMDNIVITDNDVLNNDMMGAIWVEGCSERTLGQGYGVVKHVEVMRNRVVNSGFRPGKRPTASIPAICVILPETAEIAGNFVDRSWGNGIFTLGGKGSGTLNDVPLARILLHHNHAENTMLGCNDYGGIELFQGGPVYIYNNVSRNCIGTRTFTGSDLGYNLYLDGAFKVYSFNNILVGKVKPNDRNYYGHCGYFMVFGFLDHLFNNTIFHFEYGLNGSSGNRSCILGNAMVDCSHSFMGQNRPGDASMMGGGDTGEMGRIGIPTMVYGNNVFWGKPKTSRRNEGSFGFVGGTKTGGGGAKVYSGNTLEELSAALRQMKARVSSIGKHVARMPLVDPARDDFRPAPGSGTKDMGVKFFVPWGLSRMVGEWNFYQSPYNPEVVLGEHFYMTDEFYQRGMYYYIPRGDLTVSSCKPEDYVDGPLEDWIPGALRFDGKTRFAVQTHAEMTRDMTYPIQLVEGRLRGGGSTVYKGSRRKTLDMGVNNFLVEVYFRVDPSHTGGALAGKCDGRSGYELGIDEQGQLLLDLRSSSGNAKVTGPKVNDGKWRHVIAEVDRVAGSAVLYVDGEAAGSTKLTLPRTASLTNRADFLVGKSCDGAMFAGAIDFLRVSRGTLADAKTTIEELYEWEFNGPHLYDFTGRKPMGKRDAGAIEGTR
jgi:concanavalin A-like lectin/glucanase superfamily protein